MFANTDQLQFAAEDASMNNKAPEWDTVDVDKHLEWEHTGPAEKKLLLEEDTVYAEDLVQLGLGWQDFRHLVVRSKS